MNSVIGDVELTVVPTLEDLNKEGMMMSHCIYTYLDRVVNRDYIAVHVQHSISNERATLGLYRKNGSIEFDQLKGYRNSRATREMIEAVLEFLDINKIKSQSRNSDLTPSPGQQVRMHDYLSDEDVMQIRKERDRKELKEMEKAKSEGREYVPKHIGTSYGKKKKGLFGLFN
jgi:predicted metal-dependent hydrolase